MGGNRFSLCTIIGKKGSGPRGIGTKMIVFPDGSTIGTIGGGLLEAEIIEIGKSVIKSTYHEIFLTSENAAENAMICGGLIEVLVEPFCGEKSLEEIRTLIEPVYQFSEVYIFGAGHISQKLAHLCHFVGFKYHVIDDRKEFADIKRFPSAKSVIAVDKFELAFNQIEIDLNTFIVIVTRGHLHDQLILEFALKTDAKYIGMIGSKRKWSIIYNTLIDKGFSCNELNRVHSPIGLNIGSETPEEIAVSIISQMIAIKRLEI